MEIKFNHVSFSYQKENYSVKKVFEDINITIEDNKIIGLIGKSGSGKTTILELLDGLLLPTSGMIEIGDNILTADKSYKDLEQIRKKVGLLFQFSEEQFFHFKVRDELLFRLRLYQYHLSEAEKRMRDAMKLVGLEESILEANPHLLSNGEKRKVALATVLIYNPELILFDEPTVGLDASGKKYLITLIRILKNRYHKTVVIASHDTDFIHQICDQIILIGKDIVMGTKYEIFLRNDLKKYGVQIPKVIEFSKKVLEKKQVKLGYRDEINDLIKDIYRNVS